jgi:hypothetical protein
MQTQIANAISQGSWPLALDVRESQQGRTIYIKIANIVKISGSLGQTILHYANGETELLSNQQAADLLNFITASLPKPTR